MDLEVRRNVRYTLALNPPETGTGWAPTPDVIKQILMRKLGLRLVTLTQQDPSTGYFFAVVDASEDHTFPAPTGEAPRANFWNLDSSRNGFTIVSVQAGNGGQDNPGAEFVPWKKVAIASAVLGAIGAYFTFK